MNKNGNDIIANILMFTFKHDEISIENIIQRFKLTIESVDKIINVLSAANVIGNLNQGKYEVIVKSIEDINEGIIEFLNENGFNNDMISDAFKSLTTEEKEEVSYVLKENRHWKDSNLIKPDIDVPVAIRLVDKTKIYSENKCEVLYAEDVKIAKWTGQEWLIIPPYPKFDYSPLSNYASINEGVEVSHWGVIEEEELELWDIRFSRIFDYKLKIEVDPDYEEIVYKSLMYGIAYMSKFGGPDFEYGELRKLCDTLCDMQAAMDVMDRSYINNIRKIVDKIIADAVTSSNATYDFKFTDIKNYMYLKNDNILNINLPDIIDDLKSRPEVSDCYVNYLEGTIELSLDPKDCKNYEFEDGDEEIFGCTKEEWEEKRGE